MTEPRRNVEGRKLTGRAALLLFTDDLDVIEMTEEEVKAYGKELGSWLYSNCPSTFVDAAIDEFNKPLRH